MGHVINVLGTVKTMMDVKNWKPIIKWYANSSIKSRVELKTIVIAT